MKGDFEPIVPEDVWDKCEAIRKSRTITMMKDGREQLFGRKTARDLWATKMRCKCGSGFHRQKWRANKRGDEAFGYQCYNQLNNGSATLRKKNGLPTDGYCDIKMVSDWKLELMSHKILEGIWEHRKDAVLEAYRMVGENVRSDKTENKAAAAALDGKISRLNAKIEGFITMRAEGELSKEEYSTMKAKAEAEMKSLISERATLSIWATTSIISRFLIIIWNSGAF